MSDQLARDPIDIDPFQVVEFCALEVEDCRAGHHANVDSFAIEYIAVHDPRQRDKSRSRAIFPPPSARGRARPHPDEGR